MMHLGGCTGIRVWSLWHAEPFYKSLGFRNVYQVYKKERTDSDDPNQQSPTLKKEMITEVDGPVPSRAKRVEGSHGPLLWWKPSVANVGNLRHVESVPVLRSKDSILTLRGGLGAFQERE